MTTVNRSLILCFLFCGCIVIGDVGDHGTTSTSLGGDETGDGDGDGDGDPRPEQPRPDMPDDGEHWCCDCDAAPPLQCAWTDEPCAGESFVCDGDGTEYPSDCLADSCGGDGWCCDCASFDTPLWSCTITKQADCVGDVWCSLAADPVEPLTCEAACAG